MVLIPQETLEEKINNLIENEIIKEYPRTYIGYSELGGSCSRKIWYNFRWFKLKETSARMARLFKRGDWEEERIEKDLEKIGITVFGKQKTIIGLANHIKGHIDALLENVLTINEIILAEFKTANQKRFDKFKKDNDILKTQPEYYYQAQSYMGKLKLNKCLFIVTNKNTEERWMKIIEFDEETFLKIEAKAFDILTAEIPPERIGNSTWYECKYCHFKDVCHFGAKFLKSCRSCKNICIEENGVWACGLDYKQLTVTEQKNACDKYVPLENL